MCLEAILTVGSIAGEGEGERNQYHLNFRRQKGFTAGSGSGRREKQVAKGAILSRVTSF